MGNAECGLRNGEDRWRESVKGDGENKRVSTKQKADVIDLLT